MAGHNYPREELVLAGSRQWQQYVTTSRPGPGSVLISRWDFSVHLALQSTADIGMERKEYNCLTDWPTSFNQHFKPTFSREFVWNPLYAWTWYWGAKRLWQFLVWDYSAVIFFTKLCLAGWLVISRDFDTVLLGEASVPRARVLGSIVEISTPNSSLEISSIDQTRMAVTEQTSAFSCNLWEILKILKEKITFPLFILFARILIFYKFL